MSAIDEFLDPWPDDPLEQLAHIFALSEQLREAASKPNMPDDVRTYAPKMADALDTIAHNMLTDAGLTLEQINACLLAFQPRPREAQA